MMEIQSESWKLEVMIIPFTSLEIHVILHSKLPTSHPHSNENPNWITDNDNTIGNPPIGLPYHIIISSYNAFKCQSHASPPISERTQSSATTLSFSFEISQSNNPYPYSQPFSQITLPHPWIPHAPTPKHQYNSIRSSNLSIALILSIQQRAASQSLSFYSSTCTIYSYRPSHANPSISHRFLTTKISSSQS